MNPISFPEQTSVIAEDQAEYLNLPAHRTEDGRVISLWALTWRDWFVILFTGKVWLSQLTFNRGVQPVKLSAESPFTGGND